MKDKITKLIKKSFETYKVSYKTLRDTDEVTMFVTGFELEDKNNIVAQVYIYDDHLKLQGTLPNPVRYPHRNSVSEFLQRANSSVKLGYYLFDYTDFTINFVFTFRPATEYTEEDFRDDISVVVQMLEYILSPVKQIAGGYIGPEEALEIFKGGTVVEENNSVRGSSEGSELQTGEKDNTGRNDSSD